MATLNLNTSDGRLSVEVANLPEASRRLRSHVESLGLGASDMRKGFGDVREGKALVARVSYNGRIWSPDGTEVVVGIKAAVTAAK